MDKLPPLDQRLVYSQTFIAAIIFKDDVLIENALHGKNTIATKSSFCKNSGPIFAQLQTH